MVRDLNLEKAWRERISRFEQSGLTISQFCGQEGLVSHQLSWWRRELKRRGVEAAASATSRPNVSHKSHGGPSKAGKSAEFLPIELAEPGQRSSVEIILDQPPRVAVSAGFDASLLQEVLRVLERGCLERPQASDTDARSIRLSASQLSLILEGIELSSVRRRSRYQLPVAG